MTDAAVIAEGLGLRYAGHRALDGLTVSIPQGSLCALLGRNGAGKTTLLESCVGLRMPDAGRLRVLGREPRDPELRRDVGIMLQDGGIGATVTPRRLLSLLWRLHPQPWPVEDLLTRLDLVRIASREYRRLSGGEQQRLRLAAALIGRPRLLLLDEPAAGMDPPARDELATLLASLRDDGATIVMSTHLVDEAERIADHVVVIDQGRCIAAGPLAELRDPGARLTFRARPGLDVFELSRAAQGRPIREVAPGDYIVQGDVDAAALASIAAWLADVGSELRDVSSSGRGLAELFRDAIAGGEP